MLLEERIEDREAQCGRLSLSFTLSVDNNDGSRPVWRFSQGTGTECNKIFATVRRSIPNRRAASRWVNFSWWHASRTRRYKSTVYIPKPPASATRLQRLKRLAYYYAATARLPRRSCGSFLHRRSQVLPVGQYCSGVYSLLMPTADTSP